MGNNCKCVAQKGHLNEMDLTTKLAPSSFSEKCPSPKPPPASLSIKEIPEPAKETPPSPQ